MGVKINLRIINNNHEAIPEIGFRTKSIIKWYDRTAAMPIALESSKAIFYFPLKP